MHVLVAGGMEQIGGSNWRVELAAAALQPRLRGEVKSPRQALPV